MNCKRISGLIAVVVLLCMSVLYCINRKKESFKQDDATQTLYDILGFVGVIVVIAICAALLTMWNP